MLKCINLYGFLGLMFEPKSLIEKAEVILQGLYEACSPRLSQIVEKMPGRLDAN
jgi:hypothetical protein